MALIWINVNNNENPVNDSDENGIQQNDTRENDIQQNVTRKNN